MFKRGYTRALSDHSFEWELDGPNLAVYTIIQNSFSKLYPQIVHETDYKIHNIHAHVCLEHRHGAIYFHMLELPSELELNDIKVTFVDDNDHTFHTFTATKKPCVNHVSIKLTSSLSNIYKLWDISSKIRCEFNSPSNNSKTKNEQPEPEQPFICGDSHMTKALDQFESLLDNAEFSDIKFTVEDKTLPAHKCILAARSSVFSAMLKSRMQETEQSVINIEDMNYEVLKEMLRYIYAGKVNQNGAMIAKELFAAADKYDIVELKDACEKRLCESLTTGNAIEYLNLAYLHNADNLRATAIRFIVENGKNMVNEPGFDSLGDLNKELVMEVFRNLFLHNNK